MAQIEEHTANTAESDPPTRPGAPAPLPVRVARIATGSGILAAGIMMLVLPGPGLVAIAAGLGLLSKDVPAAARALIWVRRRIPGAQRVEQVPRSAVIATLSGTLAFSVLATWFLTLR